MEILKAGDKVFSIANKHGKNMENILNNPNFSETDAVLLGHEVQMMGALWQLASGLMKELTEPLKSIVNR